MLQQHEQINDFYIVLFSTTFCYKVGQTPLQSAPFKSEKRISLVKGGGAELLD